MKFYAVRKGEKVGIYTDWNECKKQVIGAKTTKKQAVMLENFKSKAQSIYT